MTRTRTRAPRLLAVLRGRPHGRARRRYDDEGVALVAVIGTMAVVTLLLLGALGLVVGAMRPARGAQDATAAEAAAQAGLDDYVSRLNAQDTYWTSGSTDSTNAAFSAAGALVPGTSGNAGATSTARFRYALLNSGTDIATSGLIQLKVTGTSTAPGQSPVSRTLVATLGVTGFLHYIYFTDVEGQDPALWDQKVVAKANGSYTLSYQGQNYYVLANPQAVDRDCSAKYWQGREAKTYSPTTGDTTSTTTVVDSSGRTVGTLPGWGGYGSGAVTVSAYCTHDIQFTSGDTIRGPLHSNDALLLSGSPLFGNQDTTVSWPQTSDDSTAVVQPSGSLPTWGTGTPSPGTAAVPGYDPQRLTAVAAIPSGNTSLLKYVLPKTDSDPNTDRPGCLYTGATKVTYGKDANGNPNVTVFSPNTTQSTPGCFDASLAAQPQPLTRVPPVIYVAPSTGSCTGVGYPAAGESTTVATTTNYSCTRGTAFVSGTITGQSTVAAADDVVVVGNTTYSDGGAGTDVLGLVATGYVWVYHPVDANRNNLYPAGAPAVQTVDAAVLSLRHSFLVQNWDQGAKITPKLSVLGSITQAFRGPVGTGGSNGSGTGYLKDYVYDARLDNVQPPYFLKPVSAPWVVKQVTDGQSR